MGVLDAFCEIRANVLTEAAGEVSPCEEEDEQLDNIGQLFYHDGPWHPADLMSAVALARTHSEPSLHPQDLEEREQLHLDCTLPTRLEGDADG